MFDANKAVFYGFFSIEDLALILVEMLVSVCFLTVTESIMTTVIDN